MCLKYIKCTLTSITYTTQKKITSLLFVELVKVSYFTQHSQTSINKVFFRFPPAKTEIHPFLRTDGIKSRSVLSARLHLFCLTAFAVSSVRLIIFDF